MALSMGPATECRFGACGVQYFDQFPVRQPSLLFAGLAYSDPSYLSLWAKLNPDPEVEEVIRNYPIRQPVLWVAGAPPQ